MTSHQRHNSQCWPFAQSDKLLQLAWHRSIAASLGRHCSMIFMQNSRGKRHVFPHREASLWTQQGVSITVWPVSTAVGIQRASCCSYQDGLQVICQLLHRDAVTGHLVGNIDQLALLSHQVGAEHCTPCQPAVYARTLAEEVRTMLSSRKGARAKAKHRQRHTVSGYRIKARPTAHKNDMPLVVAFIDRDMQMQMLAQTTLRRVVQSVRVVHDLPGMLVM